MNASTKLAHSLSAALHGRSAGTARLLGAAIWRPDDELLQIDSVTAENETLIIHFASAPISEALRIDGPQGVSCGPSGLRVQSATGLSWGNVASARHGNDGKLEVEVQGQPHSPRAKDAPLFALEPAQGQSAWPTFSA